MKVLFNVSLQFLFYCRRREREKRGGTTIDIICIYLNDRSVIRILVLTIWTALHKVKKNGMRAIMLKLSIVPVSNLDSRKAPS